MKKLALAAATLAASLSAASAAPAHHRAWSPPSPFTPFTPPPLPHIGPFPAPPPANGVPALKDVLSRISGNMPAIVAQLQTIQWYANQPMPGSTSTPPALLDPYAAQCMPPLINFIETTPNPAALPSPPTGSATGPLVELEVVRLKAILIDEFVNAIGQRGFPPALQLGCAAYVQNAKNLPFKLGADLQANFIQLLNAVANAGA